MANQLSAGYFDALYIEWSCWPPRVYCLAHIVSAPQWLYKQTRCGNLRAPPKLEVSSTRDKWSSAPRRQTAGARMAGLLGSGGNKVPLMDDRAARANWMMDEEEMEESFWWEPDADPLGMRRRWHWTAFCRDEKQNKNVARGDRVRGLRSLQAV